MQKFMLIALTMLPKKCIKKVQDMMIERKEYLNYLKYLLSHHNPPLF